MTKSFSVSVRLRRVVTETAYVSVPLTADLLRADRSGSAENRIDVEKLVLAALELGRLRETEWEIEGESEMTMHPIQAAPEHLREPKN